MVKVKPNKSKKPGKGVQASGRGRRRVVEFKKEPRTRQKTVRVPVTILKALEAESKRVSGLSVPGAIVQILEDWHQRTQKAEAKKSA